MDDNQLNQLVDNITTIVPVFFKKMHKLQSLIMNSRGISYSQIRILFILQREKRMNMSALGKKLDMLKPNVTAFVDKLIEQELVERVYEDNDRRVIFISLTESGADFIKEYLDFAKNKVKERILKLDQKDQEMLNQTIEQAVYLIGKLAAELVFPSDSENKE